MSSLALLAVKSGLRHGEKQMREFLSALKETGGEIDSISSIYSGPIEDIDNSGQWMSMSLLFKTNLSPEDVLSFLLESEEVFEKEAPRNGPCFYLLCYEDQVEMSQKINLPHPSLHKKPELLIPAAEILGGHEHPVLKKPLSALAKNFDDQPWGRFLQQGKVLLDSQN